eukprot:78493_1
MSIESNTDWDNSIYLQDYVVLAYSYLTVVIVASTTCILFWKLYKCQQTDDKHSSFIDDSKTQTHMFHPSGDEHSSFDPKRLITRVSIVALVFYLASSILLAVAFTQWIIIINEHGHVEMRIRINNYLVPYFINLSLLTFIMFQRFNYYLQSRCVHIASFIFSCLWFVIFFGIGIVAGNVALANGNHSLGKSLKDSGGLVLVFATIV